jgi:F0F1-type ATP synthase assembly protein I
LYRYAGLAAQLLASIGIAVFIGIRADRWLHTMPVFSCVLPLLVLVATFYKLARATGNKKDNETK